MGRITNEVKVRRERRVRGGRTSGCREVRVRPGCKEGRVRPGCKEGCERTGCKEGRARINKHVVHINRVGK